MDGGAKKFLRVLLNFKIPFLIIVYHGKLKTQEILISPNILSSLKEVCWLISHTCIAWVTCGQPSKVEAQKLSSLSFKIKGLASL